MNLVGRYDINCAQILQKVKRDNSDNTDNSIKFNEILKFQNNNQQITGV